MEQRKTDWLTPLILFIITLVSRIPFTSKLLYHLDSGHFALALEKYDVYLHQPHPPGYFLYVMMGKAINLLVQDANMSYLVISVLFSGLTVVAVYYLGMAIFNKETGQWAALLALTSPLLWLYGEVALTYIVAAFFNTWIALLCWKLLHHEHEWLYPSAVILGIAAGIRQDLLIFLFPLWIFCLRGTAWRKILSAFVILGMTIGSWFIPMLILTGGPERYFLAVQELWDFHNSAFAIWNIEIDSWTHLFLALVGSVLYGVLTGIVFILFALYALARSGSWHFLSREKVLFFVLWLLPTFLLDVFIFLYPGVIGFGIFFVPALLILVSRSIEYTVFEFKRVRGKGLQVQRPYSVIAGIVIMINAIAFLFTSIPTSAKHIRGHDYNLSILFSGIEKNFPAQSTIVRDDTAEFLYSYRHIQYHLPNYRAYSADSYLQNKRGERWHRFGGINHQTILSDAIDVSPNIRYIIHFFDPSDRKYRKELESKNVQHLTLDDYNVLYYEEIKR